MQRAKIYTRYSSDRQTEASTEAQIRACELYARQHDIAVTGIYSDEAISGKGEKTAGRKQYQRLLRDCEKGGFGIILVHKYDRIARNLGEHVNLEIRFKQWNIRLIAVAQDFGDSKEAKIMRTLAWAMSEYYIDNLADETRKGHRETALKGLHNGGHAPFGYDIVNQTYVVNEFEAVYVRKMFQAAAERKGFTGLIEEMSAAGVVGKRGKPIKYTQIYEILRNEKYTGTYVYSVEEEVERVNRRAKPNAIRKENALPAIISKAQFMEVQEIMDARKQTGKKGNYLCSGLVYCECGAKRHAITTHRKGHEYKYYYCSQKCGSPVVPVKEVDKAAIKYLNELLSPENQKKITAALQEYNANSDERVHDFQTILDQKIKEKEKEYETLLKNLSTGVMPPEIVVDVTEEMKIIKEQIKTLKETTPPPDLTVEKIMEWLEALKNAPDEKAIHLLIERIEIKNKTDFNIISTLKPVLEKSGCGGRT